MNFLCPKCGAELSLHDPNGLKVVDCDHNRRLVTDDHYARSCPHVPDDDRRSYARLVNFAGAALAQKVLS